MRTVTTFFVPQMKDDLSKTTNTELFPAKKYKIKTKVKIEGIYFATLKWFIKIRAPCAPRTQKVTANLKSYL